MGLATRLPLLFISLCILISLFVRPNDLHFRLVSNGLLPGNLLFAPPPETTGERILLIPLDSRPPCGQYLSALGNISGQSILLPPDEILDHYHRPADRDKLFQWLRSAAPTADTAIVSLDMLIHGGLLSSRLSTGSEADIQRALAELRSLKQQNPHLQIHLFHIIPRLLLADIPEFRSYQQAMLHYSQTKDQLIIFENQWQTPAILEEKSQIPAEIQKKYQQLYQQNLAINQALFHMVQDNLLETLVIGQDDGQPFGLPNASKQYIHTFLQDHPALQSRVFLTRGTDEVALTLLGRDFAARHRWKPKIFAAYPSPAVSARIMPYMPHSIATTVQEKIALVGGIPAPTAEEADIVLYVFAGSSGESLQSRQLEAAQQLRKWLDEGKKVALVDLSEHFSAKETLLPVLVGHQIPLTKLTAYAGWNTTSNSIGTAITQALLYTGAIAAAAPSPATHYYQLSFLSARFLEDWHYQKVLQPRLNDTLKRHRLDPYHLDSVYNEVNRNLARELANSAKDLAGYLYQYPLNPPATGSPAQLRIVALHPQVHFPWERTFEISLDPRLVLLATP